MNPKSIKIFIKNQCISIEPHSQFNQHLSKDDIIGLLSLPGSKVIYHTFPEKLIADLSIQHTFIEAAGGIIVNRTNNCWLMIFRRGYWDLPKGKIDKGEHPLDAAKRELFEETGINVDNAPSTFLNVSYHFYQQSQQIILKQTYWYMFFIDGMPALNLQHEEDIEKAEWVSPINWPLIKQNAYASIVHILEQTNLV